MIYNLRNLLANVYVREVNFDPISGTLIQADSITEAFQYRYKVGFICGLS